MPPVLKDERRFSLQHLLLQEQNKGKTLNAIALASWSIRFKSRPKFRTFSVKLKTDLIVDSPPVTGSKAKIDVDQ